ncbi:MAG: iron transporter [Streptosporangiales bacterium]|nr:iron transporter [Streptosporangiales bacterium]
MLGNYLIGLREGLEASLVVSILVAYLVKTDNRAGLRPVALGIGAAVALALAFGGVLTFTASQLTFQLQEAFGGFLSLLAVGLVTWMIFWMRRTARRLKADIEGRLDRALQLGPTAIAVVAFVCVGREGLETALFLWTNILNSGSTLIPIVGAVLGLLTAVALAYLLYRRAVKINLARFFTWTGAFLIVVAAGVFAYGWHDLQEANILPGLSLLAFDVSGVISPASWYGILLKGTLNFSPTPTVLEAVMWVAYFVPTVIAFFWPSRKPRAGTSSASTGPAEPASAEH